MSWTDERVELLKKLWSDGLSASQIAQQLGGVTRNAVIGKLHRLSDTGGRVKKAAPAPKKPAGSRSAHRPVTPRAVTPRAAAPKTNAQMAPRPLPKPRPVEDIIVPVSLKVSLLDLKDTMCKWPEGDPGTENFHFCGHRNWNSLPYCEYHSRIAYHPAGSNGRWTDERREQARAAARKRWIATGGGAAA